MENKKYTDKILNHLIDGTKIDMVKRIIVFPFNVSLELPLPNSKVKTFFFSIILDLKSCSLFITAD